MEMQGLALRGVYEHSPTTDPHAEEWCERRILQRIHRLTLGTLRKQVEPVTPALFMRWLLDWHHLAPDTQLTGEEAVLAAIEQLEGFEAPAIEWERTLLPNPRSQLPAPVARQPLPRRRHRLGPHLPAPRLDKHLHLHKSVISTEGDAQHSRSGETCSPRRRRRSIHRAQNRTPPRHPRPTRRAHHLLPPRLLRIPPPRSSRQVHRRGDPQPVPIPRSPNHPSPPRNARRSLHCRPPAPQRPHQAPDHHRSMGTSHRRPGLC